MATLPRGALNRLYAFNGRISAISAEKRQIIAIIGSNPSSSVRLKTILIREH